MKLPKIVLISLIFACIGITTEVVFTGVSNLVNHFIADDAIDWALGGKTYLWMFFIYASIPLLFKLFNPWVEKYNLFIKALIGVLIIYIIEFSTGFLLEMITGVCPWKYTEGLHLFGYIRLDYFPFWYAFALLVIWVYKTLDERVD
ncbi:MAG: hypothetical protein LRY27_03020 [Chitinophagales bacterium]|nr:hypothetical protein [Chitinophagales bacterium]